jgi:hypothetical protein
MTECLKDLTTHGEMHTLITYIYEVMVTGTSQTKEKY